MPKIKVTDEMRKAVGRIIENESQVLPSGELTKKIPAEEIRKQVALELKFDEETGPSLRRYQTLLKEMRATKSAMVGDPEEEVWSFSIFNEYEFPFETIPVIQLIQSINSKRNETLLSIREAKWVSRLVGFIERQEPQRVIDNKPRLRFENIEPKDIYWCMDLAKKYAAMERDCKVMGIPFNSREFDNQNFIKMFDKKIQDCEPCFAAEAVINRMVGANSVRRR